MRRHSCSRNDAGFIVITLIIYAAITLCMVLRHIPWRDEADAWLTARDLPLTHLWTWMHYAGTPALWYLMLMPLAKLGAPYLSMNLLDWLIGIISAVLILCLAPFPKWLRVALIFSFYLPAEYSVVARNYATLFLLMILIAWFYPRRYERQILLGVLLALLASTATHGTIFAGALTGAWGLDAWLHRRLTARTLVGGAIAVAGVLLALSEVLPTPHNGQLTGMFVIRHPDALDYILSHTFTPIYPQNNGHLLTRLYRGFYPMFVILWLGPRLLTASFVAGTLWLLRKNLPLFVAYVLVFLGFLYVFMFKFIGGDEHTGLLWLFTWVMLWIVRVDPSESYSRQNDAAIWKWGIIPVALSSVYCIALTFHMSIMRTPYSNARAAANFLLDHHLADRPLAMYEDNCCESILPYLGKKTVWYAGEDRYGTYMLWNAKMEREQYQVIASINRMVQKSAANPDMVLVLNTYLPPQFVDQFKLVFDNIPVRHVIEGESYAIYVRPGR